MPKINQPVAQNPLLSNSNISYSRRSRQLVRKVPEITFYFWIIKLLTTAMGEATSDFFVIKYNPYLVVVLGGLGLLIPLIIQLTSRRYVAWIYWFTVTMVAVFGTMAADAVHKQLGVPYAVSTAFFAVTLSIIFIWWYRSEGTLSIHTINHPRRELFYWATVLATFALGTAAGDFTAFTLGLGYLSSGLVFGVLFLLPAILYKLRWLGEVAAFWTAYVLTRPLGASFADWMGKSRGVGGLGWGDGHVAICLTIFIVGLVAYISATKPDIKT